MLCKQCGADFGHGRNGQKFCSSACTNEWHRLHARDKRDAGKTWEAQCVVCGKMFLVKRQGTKYCSLKCKDRQHGQERLLPPLPEIKCTRCGVMFTPRSRLTRKCSACAAAKRRGSKRISRVLRCKVLLVQDKKCWLCHGDLEESQAVVHHLDGSGQGDFPWNDLGNLVALHTDCHAMFHRVHLVYRDGHWGVDGRIFGILRTPSLAVMYSGR